MLKKNKAWLMITLPHGVSPELFLKTFPKLVVSEKIIPIHGGRYHLARVFISPSDEKELEKKLEKMKKD